MNLINKFLLAALCGLTPSLSFGHKKPTTFDFLKDRPLATIAWATVLATAAIITGDLGKQNFDQLVDQHTKTPKSDKAKRLHKTIWSTSAYAALGLTGAFLVTRYAHKTPVVGRWAGTFGFNEN